MLLLNREIRLPTRVLRRLFRFARSASRTHLGSDFNTPFFGAGLFLPHPFGIVVHYRTRIGARCTIYHNVTIGESWSEPGVATVGDDVIIGAGATILGPVAIGDGAMIGAGAVVTADVAPGATVVGNPAREVGERRSPAAEVARQGRGRSLRQRVTGRSYALSKVAAHGALRYRERSGAQPVLVYQMGKVASSAVEISMEGAGIRPVYQVHFLTHAGLSWAEAAYRSNWSATQNPTHVWQGQRVRARLNHDAGERWQIVTLCREPVARNVSGFFQTGRLLYQLTGEESAAELQRRFLVDFQEHDTPLRWFDDELAATFGVDVYSEPFPVAQGWHIYRSDRADVLLIRYEDLGRVFAEATAKFFDRPGGIELQSCNLSAEKDYGSAYREFVEDADLPDEYVNRMYTSPYAKHFYTDAEREAFTQRWRRSAVAH